MNLTRNQWDNFQKLKYWNLVEQIEKDGKKKQGIWQITQDGRLFIEGKIKIRKKVWTYRGVVKEYDGEELMITDIVGRYYRKREDYADEAIPQITLDNY